MTPDTRPDAPDTGLWVSISELAGLKGVKKQSISEKVSRLVDAGRLTVRAGKGRTKLVNLAQYDLAVGEVGDGARELGAATKAAIAGRSPAATTAPNADSGRYRDEQARDKAYSADLKFIELERARGNLLPVAEFDAVAEDAAGRIADVVDGLMARDSELTAIAVKEGENGMRAALKRICRANREAIVRAMKDMAMTARARAQAAAGAVPIQAEMILADDDPVPADGV
ncbi:hypothetical protein XI06_15165 [Bradyrhizobium sp. CCBAU 11434]|uniref:hypothetical protein n=1 Tax=Bradyrhizobium sp. CCBAU 11434 TaxID=1630885 RepID=UPI00230646C8|nr:hypothetical protein [Bradyrhizobium sp. CCBAU 11434]MDA9521645.1 hypothetical protein [Bradyrhizobium sp. CCBAU 11434]